MLRMSGSNKRARHTDRVPPVPVRTISVVPQDEMSASYTLSESSTAEDTSVLHRARSSSISSLMNGIHQPSAAPFILRHVHQRPISQLYDMTFLRQKMIMEEQREMALRQKLALRPSGRIGGLARALGSLRYATNEKISDIMVEGPMKRRRATLKKRLSLRTASNKKLRSFPLPKLSGEGYVAKLGSLGAYQKKWKQLTLVAEQKWDDESTRQAFVKYHFANALNSGSFDWELSNEQQLDSVGNVTSFGRAENEASPI